MSYLTSPTLLSMWLQYKHFIDNMFLLLFGAQNVHKHEMLPTREGKQRPLRQTNIPEERKDVRLWNSTQSWNQSAQKWSISTASRSQSPIQRLILKPQERVSELGSASGTQQKAVQEGTPFIKLKKLQWILVFFSLLGKWQNRLSYKMICNSNDDLLEVFNIITIGDDDKHSYPR